MIWKDVHDVVLKNRFPQNAVAIPLCLIGSYIDGCRVQVWKNTHGDGESD